MSVVISIRIPKKLKEEMDKLDINWSEFIRNSIEREIKKHKKLLAARKIDEIRKKTKPSTFDASKSIREDRDSL